MIFYNAHDLESELLKLVLDIKLIKYETETVASECAIEDKELLLDDLYTAIKYLNDRYPKPNLFADTPEQNARLNMFLVKIIKEVYNDKKQDELLQSLELLPLSSRFLTGDLITIADLALYPILPDSQRWNAYKQRIDEHLNNLQKT